MDKLIKLLSEYTHIDFVKYEDGCFKEKYMGEEGRWDSDTEVISKEYGFVKWLVENDKIDWSKYSYSIEYTKNREGLLPLHRTVKRGDSIIMWMSIIKNPLKFLISILK